MFCTKCGKEIMEGSQFCGFCGTGIVEMTNNAVMQEQADVNSVNPQMNGGQMQAYKPQMNGNMYGQPSYNNASYKNKDNKFNFWAFLFSGWWLLFKGLWDGFLICLGIGIILTFVVAIPVAGPIINIVCNFAIGAFVGAKGNYYARLHAEQGLSLIGILRNPQLRRF